MRSNEEMSIDELINKVNYKVHMSEIGFTILKDNDVEEVLHGDDALKVQGYYEDKELLEKRLREY